MSNDTFLKDWLIDGEQTLGQITRYLDEIRGKYGVFTSFLVSERTRKYYPFTGVAQIVDESDPEDVWYFRLRRMTEPYEVNVDFNQAQGNEITIFINYRVLDDQGAFLGVAGVGLSLGTVTRILSHYKTNYQRGIYFVDQSGRITVRSDGAVIQEENIRTARGISTIADAILSRPDGYFEYERDGETMLLTSRHIPDLGWRVIVEQRESDALGALWNSFFTNLAIGIGIILVTIGTIAYTISLYQGRLEDMAVSDKLTGIGNRQLLDIALDQALKLRRRINLPFSVILVDIDRFKAINDSRGHLKGDTVIRTVAQLLKSMVREADVLCRWGGEEFILLASNCRLPQARDLAEKLRRAIAAAPVLGPDDGLRITVSSGVAEAHELDDAASLIGRADRALYRAKDEGRDRVVAEPA